LAFRSKATDRFSDKFPARYTAGLNRPSRCPRRCCVAPKSRRQRSSWASSTFRACAGNVRYCSNRYRIAALQQIAEFPSPQTWGYVVTGRFGSREETWPS
jgi:hypothetical protein